MRRIALWGMSTLSGVVLLMSYPTSHNDSVAATAAPTGSSGIGTAAGSSSGSTRSGSSGSGATTSATTSGTAASGSSSASGSSAGASTTSATKTYTGDAVSTRYGDVQVQITVSGNRVTKAEVTQVPWSDGHDQQINGMAVPILNQEAVAQQSSSIDMVSGATFTSEGYIQSLQSALDQANL